MCAIDCSGPRQRITETDRLRYTAFSIDQNLRVECMGSFRRGQADCGDVDILVTRDTGDGQTHAGQVQTLVNLLFRQGLFKHTLAEPDDWKSLDAKWMGLLSGAPDGKGKGKMRRVDVLGVPFKELGAAMIYFTGNDIFNRSLRLKARHNGFSLSQKGLFKDVIRDKKTGLKLTEGVCIACKFFTVCSRVNLISLYSSPSVQLKPKRRSLLRLIQFIGAWSKSRAGRDWH